MCMLLIHQKVNLCTEINKNFRVSFICCNNRIIKKYIIIYIRYIIIIRENYLQCFKLIIANKRYVLYIFIFHMIKENIQHTHISTNAVLYIYISPCVKLTSRDLLHFIQGEHLCKDSRTIKDTYVDV